jgi:Zn-dependent protease
MGSFLCVLYALGLYLAWKMLRFGLVWKRVMSLRFPLSYSTLVDPAALPTEDAPIFQEAAQAMTALGFQYAYASSVTSGDEPPQSYQTYFHPVLGTYATLKPALLPEGLMSFEVSFDTLFADGTTLTTTNGKAHLYLPLPPWAHRHDPYGSTLGQQWAAHQHALQQVSADNPRLDYNTPEQSIERTNQFARDFLAYRLHIGWLVPAECDNQWRCRPRSAFQYARQLLAGGKRLVKMKQAGGRVTDVISPTRAIAEVQAFERLEAAQQPGQWGWLAKTGVLLLSALVCALSFGVTISWQTAFILLGLLLLHESGHVAGMLLCNYHDRKILFLPFLGAVTLEKRDAASAGQKLLVYLLGSMPGIVLGFAALSLAPLQGGMLWHHIGVLAIILNYLHLLPILPLDGGHIVETLCFSRFPRLRCGFILAGVLALAVGAWLFHLALLWVPALALLLLLPERWYWATAAVQVVQAMPPAADRLTRLQMIFQVLAHSPFGSQSFAARAAVAKSLLQHCATAPPTLRTIGIGGLVYIAALIILVYGSLYTLPPWQGLGPLYTYLSRFCMLRGVGQQALADPGPMLVYQCSAAGVDPAAPYLLPVLQQGVTVCGTFHSTHKAHAATEAISNKLTPAETVTVFCQSIFVTTMPQPAPDAIPCQMVYGTRDVSSNAPG